MKILYVENDKKLIACIDKHCSKTTHEIILIESVIDALLFLKELKQPQVVEVLEGQDKEQVSLYNKAIFNFAGKLEDLANSSREAITKLLSVSLVAEDFVNNTISLRDLNLAMQLGTLGEQVVLLSKRSFEQIKFVEK